MPKIRGHSSILSALRSGSDGETPNDQLSAGPSVVELALPQFETDGMTGQTMGDGSIVVELADDGYEGGDSEAAASGAPRDTDNLAEQMDEMTKSALAQKVLEEVEADIASRSRWMEIFKQGLEKCGVLPDSNTNAEDVEGLSHVIHPLIVEAATQFQARAVAEVFPSSGPVKAVVLGESDDELEDLKNRVEQHMNYQLTDEDEEYFDDVDKMLFLLPFAGSTFKKTYYDEQREIVVSRFHTAQDIILPYTARSLLRTPRLTHRIYYSQIEMEELQDAGVYLDVKLGVPATPEENQAEVNIEKRADLKEPSDIMSDAEHVVYECQRRCNLELEGDEEIDGTYRDYIVSVEKDSRKLLSVRKNWRTDHRTKKIKKRQWFAHYKYLPGFGFYGYGLLHAIGGLGEAATAALNELLDAATFATRQGGFMTEDIRVPRGVLRLKPGVYTRTENTADDLSRAFYSPPFKEPSAALVKMFEILVEAGQRFGSITEAMTGESNQNTPVGTTVARIEQASMVYSAVHKRLHRSAAMEFRQRAILNGEWLSQEPQQISVEGGTLLISAQDYLGPVKIIPVSDPNITSTPQRIAMAQAQLQLADQNPGMYDRYEVNRRVNAAMRIPDYDKILIDPDEVPANDPVTEGALMMIGKPVRAYPEQSHPDHITVHMGQAQMAQGTPMGEQVVPVILAHIAEHFAQMYIVHMSQQLGIGFAALPWKQADRQATTPEMDQEISMAAAAVVDQAMQAAQAQLAAQGPQGQEQQQSPSPHEQQAHDIQATAEAEGAHVQLQSQQSKLEHQQALQQGQQATAALKIQREQMALEKDKASMTGAQYAAQSASLKAAMDALKLHAMPAELAMKNAPKPAAAGKDGKKPAGSSSNAESAAYSELLHEVSALKDMIAKMQLQPPAPPQPIHFAPQIVMPGGGRKVINLNDIQRNAKGQISGVSGDVTEHPAQEESA